jgi:hypothetical protein
MYISSGLVLTQGNLKSPNNPRLCWINYVNPNNVSALSETDLNPASNLGNPSTAFGWEALTNDEQYIDIDTGGLALDYLGIARHNLSSSAEVKVEFFVNGSLFTIFDWVDVDVEKQTLLFFFNTATPDFVRFSMRGNVAPPKIAVAYVGEATVLQRSIYVGHTPITMGINRSLIGGMSENGQYLGHVVRRQSLSTSVTLENLNALWFRENLEPFFRQRGRTPFFWAWRPQSYPEEVGYAWLTNDARPSNQRPNGMMQVSFDMEAIV